MNTKLLKKIRKRFDWYKSRTGTLVLIDHEAKIAKTVDSEYLKSEFPLFKDEDINSESLFRFLKMLMTRHFIKDYLGKTNYNRATRELKKRIN
jgi:hypothetical protein